MSFLLWGGHSARSWVQFEGSQLSVSPVPQGTAPGRGTSTALGVAEQIHPHPVSGAKLKEVGLAQNPLSGLKTPLPTPGCSVQSTFLTSLEAPRQGDSCPISKHFPFTGPDFSASQLLFPTIFRFF